MPLIDSNLHCPRDGKRMVTEAGQHESGGDLELEHSCLHCGYRLMQRPEFQRVFDGPSLLESLRDRIRAGYQRPMTPPAAIEAILEEAQ